jgi:hypothetical protein
VALVRAKAKVSSLKRCLGTGQYEDSEVRPALAHAQRMVRVASQKVQNLKEEEREKNAYNRKKVQKTLEYKRKVKAAAEDKKEELEDAQRIEEMQELQRQKKQRQELARNRLLHRSYERGKIAEADMKYLKDQTSADYSSVYAPDISGVVCSISTSAASLANLENTAMLLEGGLEEFSAESLDLTGSTASVLTGIGGNVDVNL